MFSRLTGGVRQHVVLDTSAFNRMCFLIESKLRRREARGLVRSKGRTEQYVMLWVAMLPGIAE